ncbi:MAG: hypothetical protein ACRBN8_34590 [Nannocystales bacterium]
MRKTPLQIVKEQHGSKADLINKLAGLIESEEGESDDDHKRRLRNVSNAKLLHLLDIGERAKEAGGRDGLVAKVLELKGQSKDHEYGDALKRKALGELLDLHASIKHRVDGKAAKKPKHLRTRKN